MRAFWSDLLAVATFGVWFVVILSILVAIGMGLANVVSWLFTGHMIFG